MKKKLNVQFDRAVRFLAEQIPVSDEASRKPLLPHDIRVGVYLYMNGYSEDLVIAGILHDVLEFSKVTEQSVAKEFGDTILKLVKANTKDDSIEDKQEKTKELIQRCVAPGKDALIIKTADILDSYAFYTAEQNEGELNYCKRNADAIFAFKPEEWDDPVFDELRKWQKT